MKSISLTLFLAIVTFSFSYAQWTTSGSNIYNSNTGNVGIGTTTPAEKLSVADNAGVISVGGNVAYASSPTGIFATMLFKSHYDTRSTAQIFIQGNNGSYTSDLHFAIDPGNGTPSDVLIMKSNGNVGIGTTTPITTLHLMGTFVASGTSANIGYAGAISTNFLANSGQLLIGWNRTWGSGETDFISNQGSGFTGGFAFYNHDNSNNENQLMWLQGNGNLLIGKTTQANTSYKLDVNGNVRANQVVINTTGADFVFAPNYRLNSLANVKKYIDKNHHLPEIASAKEMQANGLNVGENQIKLLQKVEELTLYLIEKDKQLNEQKNKLNDQQIQISDQQKTNKTQQLQIDELKKQMAQLLNTQNKK